MGDMSCGTCAACRTRQEQAEARRPKPLPPDHPLVKSLREAFAKQDEPRCPVCHDTLDAHAQSEPCAPKDGA